MARDSERDAVDVVRGFVFSDLAVVPDSPLGQELVAEGVLGMLEARQRYEDGAGSAFWTFAWYRIRGQVRDCLRRLNRDPMARQRACVAMHGHSTTACTRETGGSAPPPVEDLPATSGRSMESLLLSRKASTLLAQGMASLGWRSRYLVVQHGLKRKHLNAVAEELHISRATARCIHHSALEKIRRTLESEGFSLADFI